MVRIPRFSPSFSPIELRAALRASLHPDDNQDVSRFEASFAAYIGVRHAIMVGSARMGAYLVLKGWGLEPGDEVLLPALTYFSIPAVMNALGVKPVFVDVDRDTYLMDPKDLEEKYGPRCKAVIPTHLYGFPCALDPILKFAWEKGLKVLEDCAQATGARYHGKRVGSFGDAAYYTFGLTKNITTLKGGMITTDDDELAESIRREIAHDSPIGFREVVKEIATGAAMMVATHPIIYPLTLHPAIALSSKLTGKDVVHQAFEEDAVIYDAEPPWFHSCRPRGPQGAVGLVQLERIDELNGRRAAHGHFLMEHLRHVSSLRIPSFVDGAEPIYMSFPIQVDDPVDIGRALLRRGVDTSRGYMRDCSSSPLFSGRSRGVCPRAQEVERTILHIPVHPNLSRRALEHIVESLRRALLETR